MGILFPIFEWSGRKGTEVILITTMLTGTRKKDHISPILASLHWLPVKYRIDFKVLLLVFKALHGLAPLYISDLLMLYHTSMPLYHALLLPIFISHPPPRHLSLVLTHSFILWLSSQFRVTRSHCNCDVCLLFLCIVVLPYLMIL